MAEGQSATSTVTNSGSSSGRVTVDSREGGLGYVHGAAVFIGEEVLPSRYLTLTMALGAKIRKAPNTVCQPE